MGKRPLSRPGLRWEDCVKRNVKAVDPRVSWKEVAEDRDGGEFAVWDGLKGQKTNKKKVHHRPARGRLSVILSEITLNPFITSLHMCVSKCVPIVLKTNTTIVSLKTNIHRCVDIRLYL